MNFKKKLKKVLKERNQTNLQFENVVQKIGLVKEEKTSYKILTFFRYATIFILIASLTITSIYVIKDHKEVNAKANYRELIEELNNSILQKDQALEEALVINSFLLSEIKNLQEPTSDGVKPSYTFNDSSITSVEALFTNGLSLKEIEVLAMSLSKIPTNYNVVKINDNLNLLVYLSYKEINEKKYNVYLYKLLGTSSETYTLEATYGELKYNEEMVLNNPTIIFEIDEKNCDDVLTLVIDKILDTEYDNGEEKIIVSFTENEFE